MTERPIIFGGSEIYAILDGRKTQTRRVVVPQPDAGLFFAGFVACSTHREDEGKASWVDHIPHVTKSHRVRCPYGKPKDRLWVREAWRVAECYDAYSSKQLEGKLSSRNVEYQVAADKFLGLVAGCCRHAQYMPRWASRITLEITAVRVERLQDISEDDAMAEGIEARDAFGSLWDSKPAKQGHAWDSNPWVWVIKFSRLEGTNNHDNRI